MQFSRALVRRPSANFCDGITEAKLRAPRHDIALMQHNLYCKALEQCGLQVTHLPPDPNFPDACFVEDAAIIVNGTAVINRLGHPARRGEEKSIEDVLWVYKRIQRITVPGAIDGGDVMRVGDHYFIGLSKRTNEEGASQLTTIVRSLGKTATTIKVKNSLHLKTYVSSVDNETVLYLNGSIPPEELNPAKRLIVVPPEEHWAANCVGANGYVLVPENCPKTAHALEQTGKRIIILNMSEFQIMDGSLTCLSILF